MVIDLDRIQEQREKDKNNPDLIWCEKHDVIYSKPESERALAGGFTKCWDCEKEKSVERAIEFEFKSRVKSNLSALDVGRFKDATFDDYKVETREQKSALEKSRMIVEKYDSFSLKGTQVLFYGKSGTGKTMLECIIAQELCKLGHEVRIITVQRMIRSIRETFNKKESEQEKINEYSYCPFLMIDEIGVSLQSDYEKTILFEIMDERYKHNRQTLMTTNLSVEEIEQYLGFRLMRRFRDSNGLMIPFEWEEYRGNRV